MSDLHSRMMGGWIDSDELAARLAEDLSLRPILSNTMQQDKSQPPTPDGTGRPENFAVIGPGLYRSSYPQHGHFETLADLDLKTIITLVPEELPFGYANFITSNSITHHHIPILANKKADTYTPDKTVHQVLNLMLDPENYPMLIHCNKGKHRTGCMTACFRVVTGWTMNAAIEEYLYYSNPKSRPLDEAFIHRYDAELLKPLALERRLYSAKSSGSGESTKSSIYTTYTAETERSWDGLDEEVKKRLSLDRMLKDSEKLWTSNK